MKPSHLAAGWACFIVIWLPLAGTASSGTGDLQVFSEQGIEIFIDDAPAGITNAFDRGLFVEDLDPGPHTMRAEKAGFEPLVKKFSVPPFGSRAITVDADDFMPLEEPGDGASGTLILRSAPMDAAVFVDDLYKGQSDTTVINIRAGTHVLKFQRDGQVIEGQFPLGAGETLELKARFKDMEIIDISALKREVTGREAEEAAFKEAMRAGSGNDVQGAILAWSGFLGSFPDGAHVQEARRQLAVWQERREKGLHFFEGEWIPADTAAARLKEQGANWVQLDVGISLDGLVVAYVTPGSPAGRGGILVGDVILEVDKKRMKNVKDVQKGLAKSKKEKERLILLKRNGRNVFVEVVY